MAEESHVIRGINWRETFPFFNLFRSFRIAIHPSKLVLALLALLCLYIGGRILDGLWLSRHRAVPNEIGLYLGARDAGAFSAARDEARLELYREAAGYLNSTKAHEERYNTRDKALAYVRENPGDASDDVAWEVRRDFERDRQEASNQLTKDRAELNTQIQNAADEAAREPLRRRLEDLDRQESDRRRQALASARGSMERLEGLGGQGLFETFFDYQTLQINNVVQGILAGEWLGRDGVLTAVWRFFTVAPSWALRHHPIYFLLFGALFLVVWSLFGGAIARIAAVHVADEGRKLSVRQGLNFATSKFLSFISAPLIPLIIVLGLGLILMAGGLLLNIPWIGEILVGALFFLALIAGFIMTLVLLGTAGGLNLMYPTIAVEGSDSFDAISRAFSYVYARPWRMLFYSLVALVYGALCYLFIRLFIYLMLALTQWFVGLLVFRDSAIGAPLWPMIFPGPVDLFRLPYEIPMALMSWPERLGAFLVAMWVYLVIAMLGAFAISFYFSANTIIYYLMRREVDAAEMDDVYLEQPEEDFVETPPATSAATTPAASAAASTETTNVQPGESTSAQVYPSPTPPPGDQPGA